MCLYFRSETATKKVSVPNSVRSSGIIKLDGRLSNVETERKKVKIPNSVMKLDKLNK